MCIRDRPTADVFQDGANGEEELSAAGRALLDGALTDNGDSVFESPIVIEGYCTRAAIQWKKMNAIRSG